MGYVCKRSCMNENGRLLQRLHQSRHDGIFHQHSKGAYDDSACVVTKSNVDTKKKKKNRCCSLIIPAQPKSSAQIGSPALLLPTTIL